MKFKVYVTSATQFDPEADEFVAIVVENMKGRKWVSNHFHRADDCSAHENAMVTEEYLNDGGKLVRENWKEVA